MLRSSPLPAPITAMTGAVSRAARVASVARISRMVLRNVISGKPVRSVGQPSRVTSGVPPVVRIPPSVRTTSDSCSRVINGFAIRLTAGCGRAAGLAAALRPRAVFPWRIRPMY